MHPKIQTGEIDPMKNIGVLLIEFFELYGKSFDYNSVGIGFDEDGNTYYFKRQYEARKSFLSVMDPQDYGILFLI